MRGILAVGLAGLLCFGLFWATRGGRGEPAALAKAEARLDALAAALVLKAGPDRLLTIVVVDPGGGDSYGEIVRALGREPATVTWGFAALPSAADRERVAPFARILVRAAEAGVRVRVVAPGDAAGLALSGAREAGQGRTAPVVERLVLLGASFVYVGQRFPGLSEQVMGAASIGELDAVWTRPGDAGGTFHVDSWLGGAAPSGREVRLDGADWAAVALGVSRRGAAAYAAPAAPRPAPPAGGVQAPRGGLDMVVRESAPPPPEEASPLDAGDPIGDSGWRYRAPPGLRRWENGRTNDFLNTWDQPPFGVSVIYYRKQDPPQAARTCEERGMKANRAAYKGLPMDVCIGAGAGEGRIYDEFSIFAGPTPITVQYRYPEGRREEKTGMLEKVIDALSPPH